MMENLRVAFGKNYRYLREFKGYSQDKVAEGSELSLSYLSLIEQGKANPTLGTIEKLARGLNVEVADVLNFAHSKTSPQQIRERLLSIISGADAKTLAGLHNAILETFKP